MSWSMGVMLAAAAAGAVMGAPHHAVAGRGPSRVRVMISRSREDEATDICIGAGPGRIPVQRDEQQVEADVVESGELSVEPVFEPAFDAPAFGLVTEDDSLGARVRACLVQAVEEGWLTAEQANDPAIVAAYYEEEQEILDGDFREAGMD